MNNDDYRSLLDYFVSSEWFDTDLNRWRILEAGRDDMLTRFKYELAYAITFQDIEYYEEQILKTLKVLIHIGYQLLDIQEILNG